MSGASGGVTAVSAEVLERINVRLESYGYARLSSVREMGVAALTYNEQDAKHAAPLVALGGGGVGAIAGSSGGSSTQILATLLVAILSVVLTFSINRDRRMDAVVRAVVEFRDSRD